MIPLFSPCQHTTVRQRGSKEQKTMTNNLQSRVAYCCIKWTVHCDHLDFCDSTVCCYYVKLAAIVLHTRIFLGGKKNGPLYMGRQITHAMVQMTPLLECNVDHQYYYDVLFTKHACLIFIKSCLLTVARLLATVFASCWHQKGGGWWKKEKANIFKAQPFVSQYH